MTVVGESQVPGHQLIKSLATGPNGSVDLAARDGTGRQVVVKTFRPAVLVDGDAELADRRRRVAAFLDMARMQQGLGSAATGWAPVHDFGPLPAADDGPAGAYYTTDPYPASVEWLIKGHVTVGGATLRAIVGGVVDALAEVRRCCGRGHGNLTPANILMTRRDVRGVRVVLADPSPDPDPAGDESDDRWALGALIYALVMHKPVRRMMLLPVSASPEWAGLGRRGGRWLDLCNRLLARDPAARPGPAAVAAEVAKLREVNAGPLVRRAAVAASVLLAAAAAAAAQYVHLYRTAVREADVRNDPWVADLLQAHQTRPDLRQAIDGDPQLDKLLRPLFHPPAEADSKHAAVWLPRPAQFRAARAGAVDVKTADRVGSARQFFTNGTWKRVATLKTELDAAERHHWTVIAGEIHKMIVEAGEVDGPKPADALAQFLTDSADASRRLKAVESNWADLDRAVGQLSGEYNAIGTALRDHVAGVVSLPGGANADAASAATRACQQVLYLFPLTEDRLKSDPAAFGVVRDGVVAAFSPTDRVPANVAELLDRLGGQCVALGKSPATQAALSDQLTATAATCAAFAGGNAERKALLDGPLSAATDKVKAVTGHRWRAADEKRFDDESRAAADAVGRLGDDVRAAAAVYAWAGGLGTLAPECHHPDWPAAADKVRAGAARMAADPALFKARVGWVGRWRQRMAAVDDLIARQRAGRLAVFSGRVLDGWERDLRAALPRIDVPADAAAEPPAAQELFDAANRGIADATAGQWEPLATDLQATASPCRLSLRDWEGFASRWQAGPNPPNAPSNHRQAFWNGEVLGKAGRSGTPADADLIRPFAAFVQAVIDTRGATRVDLVRRVGAGPVSPLAWVARLRLEAMPENQSWPVTAEELTAVARWRDAVLSPAAAAALCLKSADVPVAVDGPQTRAWVTFVTAAVRRDGPAPAKLTAAVTSRKDADLVAALTDPATRLQADLDTAYAAAPKFGLASPAAAASALVTAGQNTAAYDLVVYLAQRPDRADFTRELFGGTYPLLSQASGGIVTRTLAQIPNETTDDVRFAVTGATASTWYCWPDREWGFRPIPQSVWVAELKAAAERRRLIAEAKAAQEKKAADDAERARKVEEQRRHPGVGRL